MCISPGGVLSEMLTKSIILVAFCVGESGSCEIIFSTMGFSAVDLALSLWGLRSLMDLAIVEIVLPCPVG